MTRRWLVGALVVWLAGTSDALAQDGTVRPAGPAVEFQAGASAFIDEAPVAHAVLGGAARFHVSRHVTVGPEVTLMIGPGEDRDLFLTGNVWLDLLGGATDRRVMPFVVVGGGLMRHSDEFNGRSFSSTEGAFTAGAGARIRLGDRWYVTGEVRLGWEPHVRYSGSVGYRFGR